MQIYDSNYKDAQKISHLCSHGQDTGNKFKPTIRIPWRKKKKIPSGWWYVHTLSVNLKLGRMFGPGSIRELSLDYCFRLWWEHSPPSQQCWLTELLEACQILSHQQKRFSKLTHQPESAHFFNYTNHVNKLWLFETDQDGTIYRFLWV